MLIELTVAAAAMVAAQRTPAVEPRASAAMVATIEQPERVGEGTSQHVIVGWLGLQL